MPTTGVRDEDRLIELFLGVYENKSWSGDLSRRESPERAMDGGVELIATQVGTGRTLAIEHTVIEPFVGEKRDFFKHFQEFQRRLRADESLREPGVALYIDAPVNVLPHGTKWALIIDDVCAWLRAEKSRFGAEKTIRDCPSAHHPNGMIPFQVSRQPLDRSQEAFVIVQRYGDIRIEESVRKALASKLPKLTSTDVQRRILMLERDQGFVLPERDLPRPSMRSEPSTGILRKSTRSGSRIRQLSNRRRTTLNSFGWVNGEHAESFTFYRGKLESVAQNGMPLPI